MNPRLRPDYLDGFITVARIVWGGDAPTWLAEQLWRWCREVCHVRDVDNLRPTRAKMKSTLLEVEEALSLVMEALESPWVREFLDGSSNGPIVDPDQLISGLVDLWDRAAEAQNFPALATKSGATKPGPGKAKLEAISPHVVCAILISEAWKHVHGVEPRPKNRRLREAAEAYWKAMRRRALLRRRAAGPLAAPLQEGRQYAGEGTPHRVETPPCSVRARLEEAEFGLRGGVSREGDHAWNAPIIFPPASLNSPPMVSQGAQSE